MKYRVQWTWRIMARAVIASMVLAGCGGAGGGAKATPATSGQAATQATATTAAEESPTAAATTAAEGSPTAAAAEGGATAEATGAATATVETTATVSGTATVETTPAASAAAGTGAAAAGGQPKLNADVSGNVELWHFWASPVRRQAVRRVIAICEQQLPNIKVTDTVKPFGDIWTANLAAVAAGSGMPDVIVSDRPTLPKDAADGIYMNPQDLATRDNVTRNQFYPWAWDQTLYENNTYGSGRGADEGRRAARHDAAGHHVRRSV
jgi:ABC-type glycerol-3-phosphate transport system substrate-binding protein